MPLARIEALTLHYQQAGRGPDLVMIHGLFSNLAFWYLSVLQALAASFRVTVYDLRGHGFSGMPLGGYRPSDMSADLLALLDHLGIDRAHLVGHSFGGAVALAFAARHPERTRSLTLADARVPSLQPFAARGRRRRRARRRSRGSGPGAPGDLPRVADLLSQELVQLRREWGEAARAGAWSGEAWLRASASNPRLVQRWETLMRTTSAAAELADTRDPSTADIRRVNVPTLAIYGERSGCLRSLRGLERHLPALTTATVTGAGHYHPLLMPREFEQRLVHFLTAVDGGCGP